MADTLFVGNGVCIEGASKHSYRGVCCRMPLTQQGLNEGKESTRGIVLV